jgi:hypothetical protein
MKYLIPVPCAVALLFAGCVTNKPVAPEPTVEAPKPAVEAPKPAVNPHQLEKRDGLQYFEGKPFTGRAVEKFKNGQKKWEDTYKDGKLDGPQTMWHDNGQKAVEATFKDGEHISQKSWDKDGNPR